MQLLLLMLNIYIHDDFEKYNEFIIELTLICLSIRNTVPKICNILILILEKDIFHGVLKHHFDLEDKLWLLCLNSMMKKT